MAPHSRELNTTAHHAPRSRWWGGRVIGCDRLNIGANPHQHPPERKKKEKKSGISTPRRLTDSDSRSRSTARAVIGCGACWYRVGQSERGFGIRELGLGNSRRSGNLVLFLSFSACALGTKYLQPRPLCISKSMSIYDHPDKVLPTESQPITRPPLPSAGSHVIERAVYIYINKVVPPNDDSL